MSQKKLYLKVQDYGGLDFMLFPLNAKEKNWSEVLDKIEMALDESYSANDDNLVGVRIEAEIVEHTDQELIDMGVDMEGEF